MQRKALVTLALAALASSCYQPAERNSVVDSTEPAFEIGSSQIEPGTQVPEPVSPIPPTWGDPNEEPVIFELVPEDPSGCGIDPSLPYAVLPELEPAVPELPSISYCGCCLLEEE